MGRPELGAEQPELMSLIEKVQMPGGDPERLAKQIQGMLASISAAREKEDQSLTLDGDVGAPAAHNKSVARRFGRRRRGRHAP